MNQNLRVNKINFHMEGFGLGLPLKQMRKATRKSPILTDACSNMHIFFLSLFQKPICVFPTLARTGEHARREAVDDLSAPALLDTRESLVKVGMGL